MHQEKSHISLNTRPGLLKAEKNLSPSLGLVAVNLHFANKVFTAVPKFLDHLMWAPAGYKQAKNENNTTTHITAGSCYREVR